MGQKCFRRFPGNPRSVKFFHTTQIRVGWVTWTPVKPHYILDWRAGHALGHEFTHEWEEQVVKPRSQRVVRQELTSCLLTLKRCREDMLAANQAIAHGGITARMELLELRPRASGIHSAASKMASRLITQITRLEKELADLAPKPANDLDNF